MKITEDMMTEWFPANVRPVHIGEYECDREEIRGRKRRVLRWDGLDWRYTDKGEYHQIDGLAVLFTMDGDIWRGLKEQPK